MMSLNTLFCEVCEVEFDYTEGYKHECFNRVPVDQLQIVGNVLTKKSSSCELEDAEVDGVEYLDEFRSEIFRNVQKHPHTATTKETEQLAMNKGTESPETLMFDESLDVDENSKKNSIKLLEVIKEQPCLWNFKISVAERSSYIVAAAWNKVALHLPGWNEAMVRSKFYSLKKSYNRKKKISPSGSAGLKKSRGFWNRISHF